MEWEGAAIVLSARRYGEGSAVVHVFTEDHGRTAGLVRGGASRRQAALWQPGNLLLARRHSRLSGQLGQLSGEVVQETGSRLLDRPLELCMLASAMALADGALPEHESHPDLFVDTVRLAANLSVLADIPPVCAYVRWEQHLLSVLGYGLSLKSCAVTGQVEDLAFVSPRTGRAVSEEGAGTWKERLLRLPHFMMDENDAASAQDWLSGIDLTGHFLARDLFGTHHRPLPEARLRLRERIRALADDNGLVTEST